MRSAVSRRKWLKITLVVIFIIIIRIYLETVRIMYDIGKTKSFSRLEQDDMFDFPKLEPNNDGECKERKSVMFLKTHKTGSTTVANIIFRFGLKRKLTFGIGKGLFRIGWPDYLNQSHLVPFLHNRSKVDIIASHLKFEPVILQKVLPADAAYITIIREPFKQFISAANYFHLFDEFPDLFKAMAEPENAREFWRNFMSQDLGYPTSEFSNATFIDIFIKYIDFKFDLVMIMEYFDESLILLRRTLCWGFQDILYLPVLPENPLEAPPIDAKEFSQSHRQKFYTWNAVDKALYNHFNVSLWHRIHMEGQSFHHELKEFRGLRSKVSKWCASAVGRKKLQLVLPSSVWNPELIITPIDCKYMTRTDTFFVKSISRRYYKYGF